MKPVKEEGFLVSEPNLPFTAFINKGAGKGIHWHTYIEMLYVISGEAAIIIGFEKFHVTAGDFLIINSHEIHSSQFFEGSPSEILVIQFEPWVINSNLCSLFESKYILPFLQNEVKYSKHFSLEEKCDLKLILTEILDEFAHKKPGYELNVKGNIYKLFSWLIRNNYIIVPSNIGFKTSDLLRLKDVLEYIEKNYSNQISNRDAANIACMSYHYFCRFFKKVTGKTFIEYLNFVRMHEAEKLLLTTDCTISEIALKTGYPCTSYFNKLFRKLKGISPLSYRKQNRQKTSHI